MARHLFILGGSGQIGRAVAARFLHEGWRVTLAQRGERPLPEELLELGAACVKVDRETPGALSRALGSGADLLVDTIAYTRAHAAQLVEASRDVGALAVISSASVYCDASGRTLDEVGESGFPDFPGPISETQPTVRPGEKTYSTRKIAVEHRVLDHAKAPVSILRPCAVYGPHSGHPREWWFIKRMLDGRRRIPLAYRGSSRFHTSATVNIAALLGTVAQHPESRILNAADPETPSVAAIGEILARHCGYRGEFNPLDGDEIGFTPWSIPAPFILDMRAAEALGYQPVARYEEASAAVVADLVEAGRQFHGDAWKKAFPVLAAYPDDLFDYAAEDEFFASAGLRRG